MIITGDPKAVAAAYVKARSAIESIMIKDAKGARGKFVKLASIIEAVSDILFENELVLMQEPVSNEFGVGVKTIILHSSGASIDFGPFTLPVADNNPHTAGSAISYARRYAISAVFGLAAEDDDGEAAQRAREAAQTRKTQPAPVNPDVLFAKDTERVTASQSKRNRMHKLGMDYYKTETAWDQGRPLWVNKASGGAVESSNDLSPEQVDWIIERLEARIAKVAQEQEPVSA